MLESGSFSWPRYTTRARAIAIHENALCVYAPFDYIALRARFSAPSFSAGGRKQRPRRLHMAARSFLITEVPFVDRDAIPASS
jgi:hypothetical protein